MAKANKYAGNGVQEGGDGQGGVPLCVPIEWWVDVTEEARTVNAASAGHTAKIVLTGDTTSIDELLTDAERSARFMLLVLTVLAQRLAATVASTFDERVAATLH